MMLCPTCSTANPEGAATCRACGAPLGAARPAAFPFALPVGTLLQGGTYRIGRVLGQGGFGITYAARDTVLDRSVAVKEYFPTGSARAGRAVLPAGGLAPEEFRTARERFLEEARVLARFGHPGIVQVHTSFAENDTAYMVMELLRGKSLAEWLVERGPLPESEAVGIVEKVGEALAAVHDTGLLHRDIKPDNVMLTEDGRPVLIDFGTAREFAVERTHRMTAMLTPGYAPLEQYSQQARFGAYTDVYALGATLYHLLTGQFPVPALDRVQGVQLPAPHTLRSEIRRTVNDAVIWALEVQVKNRPQSVREFLAALRAQSPQSHTATSPDQTRAALRAGATATASLAELILFCERDPVAAEEDLYSGGMARWLANSLRGAALGPRAQEIVAAHPRERWKGLELFVRDLHRAAGEDPYPRLQADPAQLDLGEHPIGGRATGSIRLRNGGRGRAWGSIAVQPELPGLTVPDRFHSAAALIEVQLDTVHTRPGEYAGSVVIAAEGVPSPVNVPIRYRVTPLEVTLAPKQIDLGTLGPGEKAATTLRVSTQPAGGRLSGTATLAPAVEGLRVTRTLAGAEAELDVAVEAHGLMPGRRYRSVVTLETNVGVFRVPVRFRVTMPWRVVGTHAVHGVLVCAIGAVLSRGAIGTAVGTSGWLSELPAQPGALFVSSTCAVLAWLGIAVATRRVRKALGAPLASWSGVKWLLGGLVLACAGFLSLVSGLGLGLILALDRMGMALLGALPPPVAWAVVAAALGLMYGAAPGLIKAGRPRLGTTLHWLAVLATLALAVWGWATELPVAVQ